MLVLSIEHNCYRHTLPIVDFTRVPYENGVQDWLVLTKLYSVASLRLYYTTLTKWKRTVVYHTRQDVFYH